MERKIQEVRMGNQALVARPGYTITQQWMDETGTFIMVERDATGESTKELWLGPGAFIVYKES